jgi:ABC-type glycerol-3-phosphate transport system substrate-binding protein
MNATKRWSLVLLGLGLTLGAGTSLVPAQGPVTVKIWTHFVAQAPSLRKELDLFEKANPGIKVELTPLVGAQYQQQIALAFKSNNSPDIFSTAVGEGDAWKKAVLESKWALPLDKWATKEWRAQFPKGTFAEGTNIFDGKVYSAPWDGFAQCCFYMFLNVQAFKDAGLVDAKGNVTPPRTWADEARMAKQIVAKSGGKVYGYGFGAKQGEFALSTVATGALFSGVTCDWITGCLDYSKGRYVYDNPVFVEWFNHFITMKEDGTIFPQSVAVDDEQARVLFAQGKFAMYINGVWSPGSWKSTSPNFKENEDYIAVPMPTRTGRRVSFMHTSGASANLAISSQTKNAEAAWKVFAFLHGKESAVRYSSYGEGVRVFPESANAMKGVAAEMAKIGTADVKIQPAFKQMRPQLDDAKINPPQKGLAFHILAAASGQLKRAGVAAAMKQLNDDFNAELKRAVDAAAKAGAKVKLEDFAFPKWNPNENVTTEELTDLMK